MRAFRVTAKRSINGRIAKGMSVQVVEFDDPQFPQLKKVAEAFKNQLGIDVPAFWLTFSDFTVEILK